MTMKLPRKGTRVRAVFDELFAGRKDALPVQWKRLGQVYGAETPTSRAYGAHSMQYVGMELARILKKYADRVSRGYYRMKDEWYDAAKYPLKAVPLPPEKIPNPFAHCALGPEGGPGAPFQAGDQVICTDAGSPGNHLENDRGYTIKQVYKEDYCPCGWMVYVDTPEHGQVAVFSSRFKLAPKPETKPGPIIHTGREPKMDTICGTCGEEYGNHFGDKWPALTDCPVMGEYGPRRAEPDQKKRYWTKKIEQVVFPDPAFDPLPPFDNAFIGKGAPEIEDMPWSYKSKNTDPLPELYPLEDHETEVAMLEARIEDLERKKWKRLEPHGYPVCTCGEHTWPSSIKYDAQTLSRIRNDLMSEEGYAVGHFSDRICKYQPLYPDNRTGDSVADHKKRITALEDTNNKLNALCKQLETNKDLSRQLIDETKDLNLLYQTRLENGKTAIDTAREMLSEILVGSLNETTRAIEDLDAQLSGTYGVLDGTMDE